MRKANSAILIGLFLSATGCDWMRPKGAPDAKSKQELAAERQSQLRKACASEATYDRLKELVFDQAARIRKGDARNLDPIAAASVVRMEEPLVKSRNDDLNVTVCSGRFILELPAGVENAFDGMRRVSAEVEYSAQSAADGSGLVYQMDGAEPIIYRLATAGFASRPAPVGTAPSPAATPPEPPQVAVVAPAPVPAPAPRPAAEDPQTRPVPAPSPARSEIRPSFNCRYARTSTERMVCASPALAARDRQMASAYYAAMANVDGATRIHLRRSRDSFLVRRERCGSPECVAAAYNARISEIRSIVDGR